MNEVGHLGIPMEVRRAAVQSRRAAGSEAGASATSSATLSPAGDPGPQGTSRRLLDTTMLYAAQGGGVRRYLTAKARWLAANRPGVSYGMVVPGAGKDAPQEVQAGTRFVPSPPLPFGAGYRVPLNLTSWTKVLADERPTLLEAQDPYVPGLSVLRLGDRLGIPSVGFCHTDVPALAALHFGGWVERPLRRKWAGIYARFDAVLTPSNYLAGRLADAGVDNVRRIALGVDVDLFRPERADRDAVRSQLGLESGDRLLVFAGRPDREKRIGMLVEAVELLGRGYVLLLVGAGAIAPPSNRVISLPYQTNPERLARLIASADAFVHANPEEVFGLVVLEALACGTPVVGFATGGVGENVDEEVGQLAEQQAARALADAVHRLFRRSVAPIRAAARRRAVEHHSWSRSFDELMKVYSATTGDAYFSSPGG